MSRWIRNRPNPREEWFAGVAAFTAGAALAAGVFYVARLVLAREPLLGRDPAEVSGEDGGSAIGPGD